MCLLQLFQTALLKDIVSCIESKMFKDDKKEVKDLTIVLAENSVLHLYML